MTEDLTDVKQPVSHNYCKSENLLLEEPHHSANRVSPQEHLLQVEPTNVPYNILEALFSQVINRAIVHLAIFIRHQIPISPEEKQAFVSIRAHKSPLYFKVSRASRSADDSKTCWFFTMSTSFLRPLGLPIISTPTSLLSRKKSLR